MTDEILFVNEDNNSPITCFGLSDMKFIPDIGDIVVLRKRYQVTSRIFFPCSSRIEIILKEL